VPSDQGRSIRLPREQASSRHGRFTDAAAYASNAVYRRLCDRGYDVFAVDPAAPVREGLVTPRRRREGSPGYWGSGWRAASKNDSRRRAYSVGRASKPPV
jgi:hypothetical protein